MFAVVEIGGSQYKVAPKAQIKVDKIESEPGQTITLDRVVLLATSDKEAKIGQPYVTGATVEAKILKHGKHEKIVVLKFIAKKRHTTQKGHRQQYTELEIMDIKG